MKALILPFLVISFVATSCFNANKNSETGEKVSSPKTAVEKTESENDESATRIPGANPRTVCTRPTSLSNDIQTIEDVIRLINALPKPVTVPCLVDVLPRPLFVNATSNPLSGQPAVSASIPRIFLFLGSSLTANIVAGGSGSSIIEFGQRVDLNHSLKGEIHFPVSENLPINAAYTTILSQGKNGTTCLICHGQEQNVSTVGPEAYSSLVNRPNPSYDVSLENLQDLNAGCKTEKKEECAIIQAIFFQGSVNAREFP